VVRKTFGPEAFMIGIPHRRISILFPIRATYGEEEKVIQVCGGKTRGKETAWKTNA